MTRRGRLHELVDAFRGRRVVVWGDAVLDRFVLGSPKRISREAPVIILRFEEQRDLPGGAANAMANVAALGGTVLPVAVVGDDEPGAALRTALAARGVDPSTILEVPGFRTVTKVRLLAGGPSSLRFQVARYDVEACLEDGDGWRPALLDRLRAAAAAADAAAISDYGYGVVDAGGAAALRGALPAGALAVADSRFGLDRLGGVDGATPNLEELEALAGRELRGDDQVAAAAESLRARLGARFVAATRGGDGITLVETGRAALHVPVAGTDEVADVTGAGDTVLAALTLALAAGGSPTEAAVLANLAGGIVVMKLGTATAAPDALHAAIDRAAGV